MLGYRCPKKRIKTWTDRYRVLKSWTLMLRTEHIPWRIKSTKLTVKSKELQHLLVTFRDVKDTTVGTLSQRITNQLVGLKGLNQKVRLSKILVSIFITGVADPDPDPHWFWSAGSGSKRAKFPEKLKKVKKFHVMKCWMFTEGFFCSLDNGHPSRRLRDKKFKFYKKKNGFFSAVNFYNFWSPRIRNSSRFRICIEIIADPQHCCH